MTHNWKIILISLAALTLAGCGGGGGGGGSLPALPPSHWETPEYHAQGGLGLIQASTMYARGGTGKGVTVGVVDTGASPDHPDLNYASTLHDPSDPNGDGIDRNGHGTHVAGIIAGRKDDAGMHGVAYEASIASFALVGRSLSDEDAAWARGIDLMREGDVHIINNSWSGAWSITDWSSNFVEVWIYPESIDALREYAAAGGVQVFAAGNDGWDEVSMEAGLPHLFSELEEGWLAVVAVDEIGELADYSNSCGVAAEWCLAAPGGGHDPGIWSTYPGGGYEYNSGTSMAAPQVAGALAALKSLFPNLSYQDLRERILFTADDTGIYANVLLYGNGLLDLDRASRPVGGTAFALGGYAHGSVVTTDGAWLALPAGAIARYLDGEDVLVLDHYQRAPFRVPVSRFAGASEGYLSLRDLALAAPKRTWNEGSDGLSLSITGEDFEVAGVSNGAWSLGTGRGPALMEGFASLAGVPLPHGAYRMSQKAFGVSFGLRSGAGELYASAATSPRESRALAAFGYGVQSWGPRSVLTTSFVPSGASHAVGVSFASEMRKPSGWHGNGAFDLSGDSIDLGYSRTLVARDSFKVGLTGRLTHLALDEGSLARLDDALLAAAGLDLSLRLGRKTTLNAGLGLERPVASGEGRLRIARGVDESGRIDYGDIIFDQADLLRFSRLGLSVSTVAESGASYAVGVMAVRDGFGDTEAIVGTRAEVRF